MVRVFRQWHLVATDCHHRVLLPATSPGSAAEAVKAVRFPCAADVGAQSLCRESVIGSGDSHALDLQPRRELSSSAPMPAWCSGHCPHIPAVLSCGAAAVEPLLTCLGVGSDLGPGAPPHSQRVLAGEALLVSPAPYWEHSGYVCETDSLRRGVCLRGDAGRVLSCFWPSWGHGVHWGRDHSKVTARAGRAETSQLRGISSGCFSLC